MSRLPVSLAERLPAQPAEDAAERPMVDWSALVARWFLGLLGVTLIGYAIVNKSFAYIGVEPVFIGEICLGLGLLAVLGVRRTSLKRTLWLSVPLLLMMGWCAVRTLPFVGTYQVDALRDGAIWGYGLFALVLCALVLDEPTRLRGFIRFYAIFSVLFLAIAPLTMLFEHVGGAMPNIPGTEIPLAFSKSGDVGVHLAGVFGYAVLLGTLPLWFLLITMPLNGVLMQSSRAALVCFAAALCPYFLYRPRQRMAWALLLWFVVGFTLFWASGFVWAPEGEKREFSAENVVLSVTSIFGDTGHEEMTGTKQWRMMWWQDIVDYTVHGDYFWGGKGFGISLADSDGYQVEFDETPLRSPHNGHMTILARAGVPGLALWIACHGAWLAFVASSAWAAHRRGDQAWVRVLIWLATMHSVFLLNASFDVFLEGPMGGIWFWTLFGVGLAAASLARSHPGLMNGAVKTDAVKTDAPSTQDRRSVRPIS